MGGSFAKALKAQNKYECEIWAIDPDQGAISAALTEGSIDQGASSDQGFLTNADLVIITLYPAAVADFIKTHAFKKGTVIIEVSGIKTKVINDLAGQMPEDVDIIPVHPMAGRENKGYSYSSGSVFVGANFLIAPTPANKEANLAFIEGLAKAMGFSRITRIAPHSHDRLISYTSQLCHVIAVSLLNSDRNPEETRGFAGDSYRDLTRIGKINEDLWPQLFLGNKNYLLASIEAFENEVSILKEAILNDDVEILKERFIESTKRRIGFEESDHKLK